MRLQPQFAPDGEDGIWTTGSADLVVRNGKKVTVVDYKAQLKDDVDEQTAREQANLYAGTVREKLIEAGQWEDGMQLQVMIAEYLKKGKAGGIATRTFAFDEEMYAATLQRGQKTVQTVLNAAATGN